MRQELNDMHLLQELVRLHRLNTGAVKTAKRLGIDRKTERKYRRRISAAGLLDGVADALPPMSELRNAVFRPSTPPTQERSTVTRWEPTIIRLMGNGLGPTAIHIQLGERFTDYSGSLAAVKRRVARLQTLRGPSEADVVIPVHTAPGQQAQVDFGYLGILTDPKTGERRKAWVFVYVLSHSRKLFAYIVFQQDIATWLDLHRRAFSAFNGVPAVVVPDNLKAAVIQAAFKASEMGTLNRSYRELARHYGFSIDPTPAFSPEKKGKVESAVKYVKNAFFYPRADLLTDIDAANRALEVWLRDTANMRVHGTTRRIPAEVFDAVEQETLMGLPDTPYVPILWHKGTVGRSVHVAFDKRMYSVPWVHIGKTAWLRICGNAVRVMVDDSWVADHRRDGETPWSTNPAHLPKHRRELADRDPNTWFARADALGEEVGVYIRAVMESDEVHYPLRRVQSMVPLLESLTPDRVVTVVRRASRYACYRPDALRRIVSEGLDLLPDDSGFVDPTWATTPRFARIATEYLRVWEAPDGHEG